MHVLRCGLRLPPRLLWLAAWWGWLIFYVGLGVWCRCMALASEQAEVEYAKGLMAYEEQNYLGALEHFRQLVALQPANPHAHFYLGLSLAHLGEFAEAIVALGKTLDLDPTLRYVHPHLGLAYLQETRYIEALEQFKLAEQFDPQKAVTQYYLGYTNYQLQRYPEALPFLQRAMELDTALTPQAQYHRGVVLYTLERNSEAQKAFEAVRVAEPGSTLASTAQNYLELLASRQREHRLWQINAEVALQYDDNVVLESREQVVDFGRRADGSSRITLGAQLLPVRTPVWRLGAEYNFFQTLHFTLHDFDIQSHTGTLAARFKWGRVTVRTAADYTYTLLNGSRFAEEVSVQPSAIFQASETFATVASLRYRHSTFFHQLIPPGQEAVRDRNGWSTRLGFDQYILFNRQRSFGRASYYFEGSRNNGTDWSYNNHYLGLGMQTPLWWGLIVQVNGTYQHRAYLHINSFDTFPLGERNADDRRTRLDHILTGAVELKRHFGQFLTLSAALVHTRNESNIAFFDYRRNLMTLTLGGRY